MIQDENIAHSIGIEFEARCLLSAFILYKLRLGPRDYQY